MSKQSILKLVNTIQKEAKTTKSYNTGLVGEHFIASSYKQMTTENLQRLRNLINQILQERTKFK
jgi:hypothetical protein